MRPTALVIQIVAGLAAAAAIARTRAHARAVRRAFEAWEAGTGSIYDLMDTETRIVIPGIAAHCGTYCKEAFLHDVAGPFRARFAEPPVPRLRKLWAATGTVAVMADATGTTRDGRPYVNTYVFVFELAGPRVATVTEFLDMAAFNAVWDRIAPAPTGE